MAVCQLESWLSLDTKSAGTLISDFIASRTVRKTFLLLISHSIYGIFVIATEIDSDNSQTISKGRTLLNKRGNRFRLCLVCLRYKEAIMSGTGRAESNVDTIAN